ncbi:carbon-nitrogen family hydrolase [Alkalihalobacterium alkalinitrilicum]|uniref:carbon-nitrogen family hydrolase n=1 Tax=Alkalihalobacterium alkalinitrilicum TaxID=427920 RepID=UPI000995A5F6|nr:carbon-nitrogen family hydrolase [Alkalihalobacterium alkalinitrilicum]
MKVAIYQMDIVPGQPEENRKKVRQWVGQLMQSEEIPDVIVLPEMWTTAYTLPTLDEVCEGERNETAQFLSEMASMNNINVVGGSVATKVKDKIYNRALIFNRSGQQVHQYDKVHLVPMLDEHLYLAGGEQKAQIFELDGVKVGVIICYDLRFPELARSLALDGAEVLFILAEWPEARQTHWTILQQARAIENQMYIISSNRVGTYDGVEFCGRSYVINPWGDIIAQGTQAKEETIRATLPLENVKEVRKNVPVFKSRVPNLY